MSGHVVVKGRSSQKITSLRGSTNELKLKNYNMHLVSL